MIFCTADTTLELNIYNMYCSTIHTSDTEHLVIEGIESLYLSNCGPGSPVGIATDYRLDGRGSIPGGDEIFLPYALVSTQPNVKWVPGLSEGKIVARTCS